MDLSLPGYFELWHLPLIFFAGFVGEAIGSTVGGGSILLVSVQTYVGAPLPAAIATDAAVLGTEIGIFAETRAQVARHKKLLFRMTIPIMLGGILGTFFLITIPAVIIKWLMIGAVIYLLFHAFYLKPRVKPDHLDRWKWPLLFVFMFLIGLYNNFLGVGEGTFSKIALMSVLGLTFIESHGVKAVAMIPIRVFSLIVTAFAGLIIWPYLLMFLLSSFLAGKYATRFMQKIPENYFSPALTVVSIGFIFYLVFAY